MQRPTSGPTSTSRAQPRTTKAAATPVRQTKEPTAHEGRLSLNAAKASTSGAPHMAPFTGNRIQELVKSIDPNYKIDVEAEEQVLQLADDFLDKVTRQSQLLAKHRGSKTLDVQDIQMVLAKHWGITVPGLGLPSIRPLKAGKPSASKSSAGGTSNKRKASDSISASGGPSTKKSNAASLSMQQASMQA